jgi:hypothetical protein
MSRADNVERVWRKSPHAFAPLALALGGLLLSAFVTTLLPRAGRMPYALPFIALLAWAVVAQVRLQASVPRRRGAAARDEPSVAALMARSPLAVSVLGVVTMGVYFLVVATLFGEPWLGTDQAAGAYGIALMGVTIALFGWEIVFGARARRDERRARQRARPRQRRRYG